jgi:hypothetical protein
MMDEDCFLLGCTIHLRQIPFSHTLSDRTQPCDDDDDDEDDDDDGDKDMIQSHIPASKLTQTCGQDDAMRKDDGDKDDDPVHILDRLTQTL